MKIRAQVALLLGLLLAVAVPAASAQDTQALVNEAMDLYQRGRDADALQKLQEVLAANPGATEVWPVVQSIEFRQWAAVMIKGGEHHAVVQALMNLALPASRAQAADGDAIKALVAKLSDADFRERQAALNQLRADHGEYAVPVLAEGFSSTDSLRRATAMEWTRRMGLYAVLPLIQVLELGDALATANALTVLGQMKDRRALPYVLAHMDHSEELVRDSARKAAADLGTSGGDVRGAFLQLAEAYYRRNTDVVDPFRGSFAVWQTDEGKVVAREVPRDIYHLKLAEEVLFDALERFPGDRDARVLLASVLVAQSAAGPGAEETAALAQSSVLASLEDLDVLDSALSKALADGFEVTATGLIPLVAAKCGSAQGDQGHSGALVQALSSPAKSVRFTAAIAQAHRGDMSGKVVEVLTEAVAQTSVRMVLVVDDDANTRNAIISDLNARGYFAYGAVSGAEGLGKVREYPIEDAVFIRYDLKDRSAAELVRLLRSDEKTSGRPVAFLVPAAQLDAAKAAFEAQVQMFIPTPPVAEAYEPELRTHLGDLDTARAAATSLAAQAAMALAHGSPGSGVVPALLGVLQSDDSVRGPAMMTLGSVAGAEAILPLLAVFNDGTASSAIRGGAAVAMGRIARRMGSLPDDARDAMVAAIRGEGDVEFWSHLGTALGLAPMDAAQRTTLQSALRRRVQVDLVP